MQTSDTIVAPATATGGALSVIRISGPEALSLGDKLFRGRTRLSEAAGYTLHFGHITDGNRDIDEVVATVYRAPRSYTGEDTVELSCHGSSYIVAETLRLAIRAGARMAEPGEFTTRAYLNGKLDLSQAEAVADLIASSSRASHTLAINQLRGGYSTTLEHLRDQLRDLCSLVELELDFSEEEVEFADRRQLRTTMEAIDNEIEHLRQSFTLGNALKEGVAVAIVGAPNVGKSTLLNRLVGDDRALVSEIAGTTRDVVEERLQIDGVLFRLLDTAGLHTTDDRIEQMGIARTHASIATAQVVLRIVDAASVAANGEISPADFALRDDQRLVTVVNKIDLYPTLTLPEGTIGLSAEKGTGIDALLAALRGAVNTEALYHGDTVISNGRHYAALTEGHEALAAALQALNEGLPTDLLAEELRTVIRAVGSITARGIIAPTELLETIFSRFCVGK